MAMSYCLPDPAHFPPARRHPRANDIRAETDAYFADAWPWRSSEELSKFQLSNFAGYTTSTIPDASYDRALWCSKVFALLFVGDDLVEVEGDREIEHYFHSSVQGDTDPRDCLPWQIVINAVFRGIEASSTGNQYPRISRSFREWLISNTVGAQAPPYTNLEAYLDFRRLNCGGYWVLSTTQYALDIHLTDEELAEPKLVMCEKLCLDAFGMENDVASYEKELASGSPSANLVAILLRHGNEGDVFDSAMAAKDHVRQKIADIEALKDSEGRSDDSRRWLRALPYIVSGNTWWGQLTKRYNIPGHPVRRKVIHLEHVGDFVEPEPIHAHLQSPL
ncbi:isoprenoid synthase domain-containing protein [Mycena rebaudengoi]|nr:isoprenoid synthase domain-containing protein [Mycena rebaudengoi]